MDSPSPTRSSSPRIRTESLSTWYGLAGVTPPHAPLPQRTIIYPRRPPLSAPAARLSRAGAGQDEIRARFIALFGSNPASPSAIMAFQQSPLAHADEVNLGFARRVPFLPQQPSGGRIPPQSPYSRHAIRTAGGIPRLRESPCRAALLDADLLPRSRTIPGQIEECVKCSAFRESLYKNFIKRYRGRSRSARAVAPRPSLLPACCQLHGAGERGGAGSAAGRVLSGRVARAGLCTSRRPGSSPASTPRSSGVATAAGWSSARARH
jgi:hypothetical protein